MTLTYRISDDHLYVECVAISKDETITFETDVLPGLIRVAREHSLNRIRGRVHGPARARLFRRYGFKTIESFPSKWRDETVFTMEFLLFTNFPEQGRISPQ